MEQNSLSAVADNSTTFSPSSSSSCISYIEHQVSKMDTLAGVAIKYGVEVADIKRMNGLATDIQMFALKSLQIPTKRRHLPSFRQSNGDASLGNISRRSKVVETESYRPERQEASPAMNSLQSYYGLNPKLKCGIDGTEMSTYKVESSPFFENGLRSDYVPQNCTSTNSKGICEGLAQRSKLKMSTEVDSNFVRVVEMGDSSVNERFLGFRKSSSASSLQDQEATKNAYKWKLKPDLQAPGNARPLFDGLPKPISSLWNKAARD